MIDRDEFDRSLEEASKTVRAWPHWKQDIIKAFGGTPPYLREENKMPFDPTELGEGTQAEDIAEAIRVISGAVTDMFNSGLNRRAIILLLHDASKVGKRDIADVLDALRDLTTLYLQDEK